MWPTRFGSLTLPLFGREREGWLYLAAILDVFNRQIVGWSMGDRLSHGILADALHKAFRQRKPESGVLFHSDRGTQYASYAFRDLMEQHGFVQSMSSSGNCYDNALMESFFHTLKTELIYFEKYRTRQEARGSVFEYIEVFYNCVRRHLTRRLPSSRNTSLGIELLLSRRV